MCPLVGTTHIQLCSTSVRSGCPAIGRTFIVAAERDVHVWVSTRGRAGHDFPAVGTFICAAGRVVQSCRT